MNGSLDENADRSHNVGWPFASPSGGSTWIRVNRHRPCPICGKADWCGMSPDGVLAWCMRVKSDRPARNGGWLHRVADAPPQSAPRLHVPPPRAPACRAVDWAAMLRRFARDTRATEVERLAAALGVSPGSLSCLGVVWAAPHHAWGFPMSNDNRQTIGIRLRAENGRKWAVSGSRNGLFWPDALTGAGPLLFCEGPSDTAALLDLGYDTIGRPSCAGAVEMAIEVVQRLRRRDVVIVADADGPGIDGADRLARALTEAGRRPKVVRPLKGKDARAWARAGVAREVIDTVIQNAMYWRDS
jgi:5S rRNA maturation endonuclease (ribonuclease M5)